MMAAAGVGIVLGKQDAIAADLVDRSDMLAVGPDDIHMLLDRVQRIALGLARRTPCAELIVEFRPVLATIFVVIPVERLDLTPPPAVIIVVPIVVVAIVHARIIFATAFGILITEPRPDFITRAREEAAIVVIVALRLPAIALQPLTAIILLGSLIAAAIIVVIGVRVATVILETTAARAVAAVIFTLLIAAGVSTVATAIGITTALVAAIISGVAPTVIVAPALVALLVALAVALVAVIAATIALAITITALAGSLIVAALE